MFQHSARGTVARPVEGAVQRIRPARELEEHVKAHSTALGARFDHTAPFRAIETKMCDGAQDIADDGRMQLCRRFLRGGRHPNKHARVHEAEQDLRRGRRGGRNVVAYCRTRLALDMCVQQPDVQKAEVENAEIVEDTCWGEFHVRLLRKKSAPTSFSLSRPISILATTAKLWPRCMLCVLEKTTSRTTRATCGSRKVTSAPSF